MNIINDLRSKFTGILEKITTIVFVAAVASLLLIVLIPSLIPPNLPVTLTILGFALTYISFMRPRKEEEVLPELKSLGADLQGNTIQTDQNFQQIIAQINLLEESQKALTDQIQSLKASTPAAEPPKSHEDEDLEKG